MKAICLFAFAAVALVLSQGLSAEEMSEHATFQQLDQDNDGYVSIIEATGQTELLKKWTEVDKDTDGRLEVTEFSAFEEQPASLYVPNDYSDADDPEIGAAPTE